MCQYVMTKDQEKGRDWISAPHQKTHPRNSVTREILTKPIARRFGLTHFLYTVIRCVFHYPSLLFPIYMQNQLDTVDQSLDEYKRLSETRLRDIGDSIRSMKDRLRLPESQTGSTPHKRAWQYSSNWNLAGTREQIISRSTRPPDPESDLENVDVKMEPDNDSSCLTNLGILPPKSRLNSHSSVHLSDGKTGISKTQIRRWPLRSLRDNDLVQS